MRAIKTVKGNAIPLNRADVDTDQIIPKQFLKRIERSGYGPFAFFDWKKDPSFVTNNPAYDGAPIMIAQQNFGCGSSREHAVWGLEDMGITAAELHGLNEQQQRHRHQFNSEAERILRFAQAHYRKSEPDHYPCLSRHQWEDMFQQGYGIEYRIWHLALCLDCLQTAWDLGFGGASAIEKPRITLQMQP